MLGCTVLQSMFKFVLKLVEYVAAIQIAHKQMTIHLKYFYLGKLNAILKIFFPLIDYKGVRFCLQWLAWDKYMLLKLEQKQFLQFIFLQCFCDYINLLISLHLTYSCYIMLILQSTLLIPIKFVQSNKFLNSFKFTFRLHEMFLVSLY